jgi:hypothetical protein
MMGETAIQGTILGSDGLGKKRTIPNESRESIGACSRIEIRADNGRIFLYVLTPFFIG